ncbi:hypothetical protein TVAG_394900 [Trichomonas vaginalis G3]|uniref:receptor protein-tyrosine kinase n=1 Tax=Trichomonas vaginalis (strain ATCC PRA-98 / G3) TaxID=412133 RepID=A2EDF4_TRIV3|nr:glycine-rich protein family [Trichomonas vaginalis G3]EAY09318.1 hypothetical protein TVAG_394900 [Trichomonas vaginalis G3]KAI5510853.1 glycine-rich protein family [Trichomonas vaginalis G3]|eukprot:XP_001321541.1 hypothetical protein [Trichomonas vaginalis G3]
MIPGGYGGGGSASNLFDSSNLKYSGSGSGGGQTSVKFLINDLWHRVIVSGGGGGSDNGPENSDNGSGGAGSNLVAQGYWNAGTYTDQKVANSLSGFTFGSGEAAQENGSKNENGVTKSIGSGDRPGSGGGWFGGFAGHSGYAGSGGGSSWILTKDAVIPPGLIEARDEFYEYIDSQYYAFNESSDYYFDHAVHAAGVWDGNGKLIITQIDEMPNSCHVIAPIVFLSLFRMSLFVFITM